MGKQDLARQAPWTSEDSPEGARPAATLILLRDLADRSQAAQLLMVQRATTMSFAAGATVFPGGAVDDADRALAEHIAHGLAPQDAAARIAAIRETIEEAGIAVGLTHAITPGDVADMRAALHAGSPLAELLDRRGYGVDLQALVPFARWCPQTGKIAAGRHFDTRFYVARAPGDDHIATPDTTENIRLRWASAIEILADCDAGRERVIFPTRRNLERLARGACFDEVVAIARAHAIEMVTPWFEVRDGEMHLCIPDHLGYPVTSQLRATIQRS